MSFSIGSRNCVSLLIGIIHIFLVSHLYAQTISDNESEDDNRNDVPVCLSDKCYQLPPVLTSEQYVTNLNGIVFAGPINFGGRTKAIVIDRSNSNHILAGAVLGGIWKSYNNGKSWLPVNDTALSLSVTCMVQDNFNPAIIYYGGGQFYRDSPPLGVGIFESKDTGKTFNLLPGSDDVSAFQYCNTMASSFTNSGTLYIGTYSGGLYKATDTANTFQQVLSNVNVTDVICFPNGEVMAGVYGGGIYISPSGDSGTFIQVNSGLPTASLAGNIQISYCKQFPNYVYAVYGNKLIGKKKSGLIGVYRSSDYGATWQAVTNPDANFNFFYPNLALTIACKPDDPSFILCGGGQLTYSNDSGHTWHASRNSHVDEQTIVFNPNNNSNFYVGNDGGIYSFNTNTLSTVMVKLNSNYDVAQFSAGAYFPSGLNALAGSWDNYPQLYLNGQKKFIGLTRFPSGSDNNIFFCYVSQQDSNISYVEASAGILFRSDNTLSGSAVYYPATNDLDGDANGLIDEGALHDNPYEMNLLKGNQLYYLTQQRAWRTINGGLSWMPLMNKMGNLGAPQALGISYNASPELYIGATRGIFFRVDHADTIALGKEVNLSASVPLTLIGSSISCITVDPADSSIVYVAYNDNTAAPRVMKITQATTQPAWTDISGDLPAGIAINWLEVDPANPNSFFIAATNYGIFTTTDSGAHWGKEALPNVKVMNIRLRKSDRKLFIFTAGRGLWTANLTTLQKTSFYKSGDTDLSIKMYPNPAKNSIIIKIDGRAISDFNVDLIDNLGREVIKQNYKGNSGTLDVNRIAKGIYYVKIYTQNRINMQKIVKL